MPYTPAGIGYLTAALAFLLSTLLIFVAAKRGRVAFLGLPILAFVATLIGVFIHGALLSAYNLWLGWVTLGVYGFFGGWSLFLIEHARLRHERSVVMQNLTSYLPQETARKVAFQMPSSSIQADRFEVTLLSADLRNFSALGESRPPEETAAVLHYFFSKVSEIVEHNGGRVHEYKGDSVLAVWDGDGCGPAERSLRAAQAIESQINANLLSELPIEGLEPLAVGIGIEQGPALIGSIGPAHRRAQTLCGEVVTVTLRIQEMTADLAYPVLIGEVAARYLPDVELESLGHYLLPGLRKAHVLFTPLDKNQKSKEGLRLLQGGLG